MLRNQFADLHVNQIASSVLFHRIKTRKKNFYFPPLESDRNSFCIHSKFYKTDVKKQVCWPPLQSDSQQRIVSPHKNEKKKFYFPPLESDRNSFCIHSKFYKTDVRKQVRWPPLQSDSQQRIVSPHKNEKKFFISLHLNQIGTTFGFVQNFIKQMLGTILLTSASIR